jgi:hypothetical protein
MPSDGSLTIPTSCHSSHTFKLTDAVRKGAFTNVEGLLGLLLIQCLEQVDVLCLRIQHEVSLPYIKLRFLANLQLAFAGIKTPRLYISAILS